MREFFENFDALRFLGNLYLALAALAIPYWLFVLFRVRRSVVGAPAAREGLDLPEPTIDGSTDSDSAEIRGRGRGRGRAWPRVAVIVPAHNEQRVIDACAAHLRGQDYPDLQIIFVLDRCTDRTAALLARHAHDDPRITIIHNDSCPSDWAGKCNAARLGAAAADAPFLLFTDADTRFDPQLVRASVALASHRGLALLSMLSTLTVERRFELVVQPVATLLLMSMYPLEMVNRPDSARPFANGQFLLFRRDDYDRIGGHAAVKDDLLEDIAFARLVHGSGGRVGLARAGEMLIVSMYDSYESFVRGWKRIFIEACKRKPDRLRKAAWRMLASGILIPAIQWTALALAVARVAWRGELLLPALMIAAVLVGWIIQIAALGWIYSLGGAPKRGLLFYSLGCWRLARIMFQAASDLAHRRPVTWGGKTYVIEPR